MKNIKSKFQRNVYGMLSAGMCNTFKNLRKRPGKLKTLGNQNKENFHNTPFYTFWFLNYESTTYSKYKVSFLSLERHELKY